MKTLLTLFLTIVLTVAAQAQITQNTYTWGAFDHSAWKIQPNSPTGYVIAGNKFFEPGNSDIYMTGFGEFGEPLWNRTHATGQTLQTQWKSFTVSPWPTRYFIVLATASGAPRAYALLTNATGHKLWDRLSAIPSGVQFGGVTNATNGGWIATGGDGSGNMIAAKFNAYGELQWLNSYPVSAFGWTIMAANGGGYYMAGTRQVVKIDHLGNFVWSTTLNLPISPDGSAYTYTEFEELMELPNGLGFILTGSAFSNQTSAAYTARFSHAGGQQWSRIHAPQNTALPGTPVSWINNAIQQGSTVITSWRTGPVSSGGTIMYQRMNNTTGALTGGETSFGNSIPLQEGFWTNAHSKIVVGGTRGGYTSAVSYVRETLPQGTYEAADRGEPVAEANLLSRRVATTVFNADPRFIHPASRVFASELRVFPNPVAEGFVNVGGKLEAGALLRVVSMNGAIVSEREIQPDETQLQLDLTGLNKGMYSVEMIGKAGVTAKKIMIQ